MSRLLRWWLLTAEAALLICLMWVLLRLAPYPRIIKLLGFHRGKPKCASPAAAVTIDRVSPAIAAASRRLPFCSCLERALAAALMLSRRQVPVSLCIGVQRIESIGLKAHAWLLANQQLVTGDSGEISFVEMIRYS